MSIQLPTCLKHCLQCQRKLSERRWKNNLNNIRTHAHFLIKLSTGKFWELGMGWHPYGCCVSLPCHTSSGSRNRDLKRTSRNTNINNIRKANWMCLDKWATSSDFSAYSFKPKLLNKVFVQTRKPVMEFKCLRVWEPEATAQTSICPWGVFSITILHHQSQEH